MHIFPVFWAKVLFGLPRYVEAIREFNKILLYIYKTKQYHQSSPQYEQILKKNEQMYALLAICLSLCPQTKLVEETVNSQLREKYGDKIIRMQRYDDEAFAIYDELFSYACPKFITPSPPNFEEPLVNYNQVCTYSIRLFGCSSQDVSTKAKFRDLVILFTGLL